MHNIINHREAFIELYVILGEYYLFDVNTNCVYEISEPLFRLLKKHNKNVHKVLEVADSNLKAEIQFLLAQGCLSNHRPQCIEHPGTHYIESLTSNYLTSLILQVTKMCNFKCRYCPYAGETNLERDNIPEKMSWKTAKQAIDFFSSRSRFSKTIDIAFYGGEPLLNYDVIYRSVLYSEEIFKGRKITYQFTTNLSVLTDEMIEFFNKHNFTITVSLDGSEKIHNKNRRYFLNGYETYADVIKNLRRLSEHIDNFEEKVKINSVRDPEEDVDEYTEYFRTEALVNKLKVESSPIDSSRLKNNIYTREDYKWKTKKELLRLYIKYIVDGYKIDHKNPNPAEDNILKSFYYFSEKNKLNEKEHHQGPCVPGVRKTFVTTDGLLLPCEKVSELSSCMIIGDINSGFKYDKLLHILNIGKLTEEDCLNCPSIRSCKICAQQIDNIIDLSADVKKQICVLQKGELAKAITDYIIFKKCGLFKDENGWSENIYAK